MEGRRGPWEDGGGVGAVGYACGLGAFFLWVSRAVAFSSGVPGGRLVVVVMWSVVSPLCCIWSSCFCDADCDILLGPVGHAGVEGALLLSVTWSLVKWISG